MLLILIQGQTSDSSVNETGIIKDVLNQSLTPLASLTDTLANNAPRDSTSDETLTAIVISQRERFRIRNVELENVVLIDSLKVTITFVFRKMFH